MAGIQQSQNDMNIQSIVAAVVNNLHGLPSPVNERSANSLEYRFINEQDELRNMHFLFQEMQMAIVW